MAKIETLQKRIAGKEKEITKLQKKLERIRKAEASGWEDNPYYYSEYDLKWATRDLETAQKALEDYRAKLQAEMEKANSRNIPAILDFLARWKKNVRAFYEESFPKYLVAQEEYYAKEKEYCDWFNSKARWEATKEEREAKRKERSILEEDFRMAWSHIMRYEVYKRGGSVLDTERLQKDLDREADQKYDDIVERTNRVTGQITDASELSVGDKGDLNGYIIGEKGTAKVQTIGAGGYNIQCFHFRTLINPVK